MQKSKYETPQVKVHAVAMDAGLLAGSNEITGGVTTPTEMLTPQRAALSKPTTT